MEFLEKFKEMCEKNGIMVYQGIVYEEAADAILEGGEQTVIDYCRCNGIQSIILSLEHDEPGEIDAETIRTQISNFFEHTVNQYPYNRIMLYDGMVEELEIESYKEVLDRTIEQFNLEFNSIQNSQENTFNDTEESIVTIDAWIFHNGYKICVNIFDSFDLSEEIEDAERDRFPTEERLATKYFKILKDGLTTYQKELVIERNQEYKEEVENVLSKIRDYAKNYQRLVEMKTQKSRNDLAERLYAKCTLNDQCQWLTKKEVCDIVNEEYMRKIGMEDVDFSL